MDSFIVAALALCSLTAPAFGDKGISKARSCSDIRLFYSGKGFALDAVPQSELSGEIPLKQIIIITAQRHTWILSPHTHSGSNTAHIYTSISVIMCPTCCGAPCKLIAPSSCNPSASHPRPLGMLVYFGGQSRTCSSTIYCLQCVFCLFFGYDPTNYLC